MNNLENNNKNTVVGPFTDAEWYTMRQLKKDIEYSKRKFREGESGYYNVMEQLEKKLNKYLTKQAA